MASLKSRGVTIYAYYVDLLTVGNKDSVRDRIRALLCDPVKIVNGNSNCVWTSGQGHDLEMRNIVVDVVTGCITGTVSRIRQDKPPVRLPTGAEQALQLPPGGSLLEHNHFLYRIRDRLLLWHFNLGANHANSFGAMLSLLSGNLDVYTCTPVVNKIAFDDAAIIDGIEFRVSPPRGSAKNLLAAAGASDWSVVNPHAILAATGATRFTATVSTRRQDGLKQNVVKDFLARLLRDPNTKRLRVKVEGYDEPIDLMTDRFKHREEVQLDGNNNLQSASFRLAFDAALSRLDAQLR